MLLTNDAISLAFGIVGTLLAIGTILATVMIRNHPWQVPVEDIEMQPLTSQQQPLALEYPHLLLQPQTGDQSSIMPNASEHDAALKALELVLGLFRRDV